MRSAEDAGLLEVVVADGRPLLLCTALALLFSGAFAIFLSVRREFLPHDVAFLGMTPAPNIDGKPVRQIQQLEELLQAGR